MRGYLSEQERKEFVSGLARKRTRSLRELGVRTGFTVAILQRWFSGARIRRSSAERVRDRLGMRPAQHKGLDRIANEIRWGLSAREMQTSLCNAAVILADMLGLPNMILRVGRNPKIEIGSSAIELGHVKGETCYRVFDDQVFYFEGNLSDRTSKLVKEFIGWRDARERETAAVKQKVKSTYDKFHQSYS